MKKLIYLLIITIISLNLTACGKKSIKPDDYTTLDEINMIAKTNLVEIQDSINQEYQIVNTDKGIIAQYLYNKSNIDYCLRASLIKDDISDIIINEQSPFFNNFSLPEIAISDDFLGANFFIDDVHYCLLCKDKFINKEIFKEEVKDIYANIKESIGKDKLDDILMAIKDGFLISKDLMSNNNVGYAYLDINQDGTNELLIGIMDLAEDRTPIYHIFFIDDNKYHVINGDKDDHYQLCEDGHLLEKTKSDSGFDYHLLSLDGKGLKEVRIKDYSIKSIDFTPINE